jgi:hypothetical protein
MNVLEVSNDEYTQRDARRRKQAQRIHRPDVVGSWGRASSVAMVLWAMRSDCTKPLTQRGRCHRPSSRRQRRSMSAICASGCLIRQLRTISPTTRCHQASRCQSSKPWCSRAMTVPSISWAASMSWRQVSTLSRRCRPPQIRRRVRLGRSSGLHVLCGRPLFPARLAPTNWCPAWLPALDGVTDKLQAGARVANVGCGTAGPPS